MAKVIDTQVFCAVLPVAILLLVLVPYLGPLLSEAKRCDNLLQ